MQDIDFDEIDRAVSSVTTPRVSRTPRVTVDNSATTDPVPAETFTAPVVVEAPSEPSSPAVRRSSGRFMDVVHSSSDMRPAPTRTVSPMTPEVVPTPTESVEPEAPAVNPSEAFHWPDPIDANDQSAPEASSEPVVPAEPVVPIIETPAEPEPDAVAGPLESPFLADAKVEKRPLGAFSDPDSELLTPEDFPSSQTQAPEPVPEPEVPQNHEEPAEVPEELHEDLLKLEAHGDESQESNNAPLPEVAEVPVGPTSITQQYKEQPSSATDASGAIFDTEIYNLALVHTPKNNKKVLIVVWIAAVILVGGAIGAAIYFVIKPALG